MSRNTDGVSVNFGCLTKALILLMLNRRQVQKLNRRIKRDCSRAGFMIIPLALEREAMDISRPLR
jgi:hypothetical protein